MVSTEQNAIADPDHCDNAELCIKRLSRKLTEVEIVMTTQEGKTNQMRKERDAERAENERLRKEITKLNNELLRERTNSAQKEKEIRVKRDETVTDGKKEAGNGI